MGKEKLDPTNLEDTPTISRTSGPRAVTEEDLENWFSYHAPNYNQQERYTKLRATAYVMGKAILDCTPAGSDQTASLRKLRECVMTANAAIACGE